MERQQGGLFGKDEFELRSGDEVLAMVHAREQTGPVVKRGRKHGLLKRENDYLEFSDGLILTRKKASKWHDEWDWVDSDGRPLIHFQRGHHVGLEPLALSLPELSLLVIAGWQLMKLQEEARTKAAVASTTSSHVVINH